MPQYKQCRECAQVVEWEPPSVTRGDHYVLYPMTCRGGNEMRHCPRFAPAPATALDG
jgi:MinD superfamily P-loop ATPase